MRVMISQPMRGKTTEEIRNDRKYATEVLEKEGNTILDNIFDESIGTANGVDRDIYMLSKCIELISEVDAVVFIGDWQNSRGCQIEYQTAIAYGKYVRILN